tara:strand:+ start:2174 stop:2455 length:282 start_codon:yes stop_codon:yes gene_type:complete
MNSQEYNEMSLQFKEIYDKKEKELKQLKKKYLDIYKILTCIYGLSRCYLMYGNDSSYIEDVRGMTSSYLFKDMEEDSDDELTEEVILNLNIPL